MDHTPWETAAGSGIQRNGAEGVGGGGGGRAGNIIDVATINHKIVIIVSDADRNHNRNLWESPK